MLAHWFGDQLQNSAETLIWSIQQLPADRLYARPPHGLGEWSGGRHLFHIVYYEEAAALPNMGLWRGQPMAESFHYDEESAWEEKPDLEQLVARFRAVRQAQLEIVSAMDEADWAQPKRTNWGVKTLRWVVTKTCQHTAEHTHDILSLVLFWDDALRFAIG